MRSALWKGTPLEQFSEQLFQCPSHRMAYALGQIEQTVFELFGCTPDDESGPAEAQQVAKIMLHALQNGLTTDQQKSAAEETARIVNGWRQRQSVH
jgi:hypothetical protein